MPMCVTVQLAEVPELKKSNNAYELRLPVPHLAHHLMSHHQRHSLPRQTSLKYMYKLSYKLNLRRTKKQHKMMIER